MLEWVAIAFSVDLPDRGMGPMSPAFQADCVPSDPRWMPQLNSVYDKFSQCRICLQCRRWIQSLGQEDPLEKEMANHPSILAWKIPWTEDPGGLQSLGLQESDLVTKPPPHM